MKSIIKGIAAVAACAMTVTGLAACGDILAMAKAVGVMTENMRTDRCDNTQCDGSRCKGNTMFRLELDTENRRVHRRRHAR